MMRSIPVEWGLFGVGPWNYSTNAQNVYDFWVAGTERAEPYESIFTIGMRGDGDCEISPLFSIGSILLHLLVPLSENTNIALLEQIVSDQRQILTNVFNESDVTNIPQMWALCG